MATVTTSHPRKRPITPSGAPTATFIEPERRQVMIAEAAYYLAERRGFCPGAEFEDWLAAETEIDRTLSAGQTESPYGG